MREIVSLALVLLQVLDEIGALVPRRPGNGLRVVAESVAHPNSNSHSQFSLPTPQLIESYGYVCESHSVTTVDGYVNTLHRIPAKERESRVVFVQHGFLGTSADFVMGRPDKSLGFVLHDAGYDVWLGNARGNTYSRGHVNRTVSDSSYWAFSFDEMGKYDLPAALEHVLKTSNVSKLSYIGHSMGTTMFWVACHEHSHYMAEVVDTMIALAPVAYLTHMRSPIRLLAPFVKELKMLFWLLGVNELAPSNELIRWFDRVACDENMTEKRMCQSLLFLLTGFDAPQMNDTLLPIILGHEPGGASTRTVVHFAQEVDSHRFCKYDYGSSKMNLLHYDSITPPDYDLERVRVPVFLMAANNDYLAALEDVDRLRDKLDNVDVFLVPDENFNHVDFLWAIDADSLVFPSLLHRLAQSKEGGQQ